MYSCTRKEGNKKPRGTMLSGTGGKGGNAYFYTFQLKHNETKKPLTKVASQRLKKGHFDGKISGGKKRRTKRQERKERTQGKCEITLSFAEKEGREAEKNKAGYTATPVACGWAGAIIEVSGAFGQEQ